MDGLPGVNLANLNPQQKEGVLHPGGPLLVLAGAGTGKTRVITYRIANLIARGVAPDRILAVTFTNKAAGEMRRRIEELSPGRGALVWIHTFHAFAARLLRRHHARLKLPQHFTIYDQSDQKRTVVAAMKTLGLEDQNNKAAMYVSIISRAKDDLLDAQSYSIHAMTAGGPARKTAADIYLAYQRQLDAAGVLDFGDLLLRTCVLLREHEDVRAQYQEQFQHMLVDEYQDTNHAQYVLTRTLAAKHRNVCVVGDDDQSVYSWRGANIRNILEFETDFPDAKVVTLEQNYRSTLSIIEAAGKVIRNNKSRKPKTLWTDKPAGEAIVVRELPSEMEEAAWVARRVSALLEQGRSLRDMAVFYRTNAQSRSFEEALRRAGLPYVIVGAVRFYERKEIKDALAYGRLVLNHLDAAGLRRVINVPPRGLGKTSLERIESFAEARGLPLWEAFRRAAEVPQLTAAARGRIAELVGVVEKLGEQTAGAPASRALAAILEATGYWGWLESQVDSDPEAAGRLGNLQELLNAAKEHEEKQAASGAAPPDLSQYLESVSLQSDIDAYDPNTPAVTLMTVHLAKGLEYPAVFLTGLEEGLFPIGSAGAAPEELEEERRLCYVGFTRARELLHLTYASTRRIFGQVYANLPSRFIIEAQLLFQGVPARPAGPAAAAGPRPVCAPPRRLSAGGGVAPGLQVRHPDFGRGRVVETAGSGDTLKVTVRFDDGRTTKFLARYAPLERA
ncbi:MAG: UvrD-helicase domain-containing protein [Elusimicrobia bacterium]|nr:UvrD-helicase domain-containing protein [Elusimicrobiota bacterium]